ncbi:unnamed protein product [Parajaminaea phylloscopi]
MVAPSSRDAHTSRAALYAVLVACFASRLALFAWKPDLVGALEKRLELNEPFNSWNNVCKVQWSLDPPQDTLVASPYSTLHHASPGDSSLGSVLGALLNTRTGTKARPPPLVMMILGRVAPASLHGASYSSSELFVSTVAPSAIFFALLDTLSAFLLFRITSIRLRTPIVPEHTTSKRMTHRLQARHLLQSLGSLGLRLDPHPLTTAALFAFNPLTVATCLARSGTTLTTFAVLMSVWAASSGYSAVTGFSIALASLTSLHPLLFAPALIWLCARQKRYTRNHVGRRVGRERKPDETKDWSGPLMWTLTFTSGLAWLSAGFIAEAEGRGDVLARDWLVLAEVYKTFLTLPSLTPSLSLWWYFFIEIFDHFRDFFLLVFNAHLVLWTVPVTLRFRHDPLFAVFLLIGVQAIFKPYPTAGDVATWWSLSMVFSSDYAPYLRNPLPPVLIYLYSTLLVPLFSHLFLTLGSGNANFLYAVGLVWSLGGVAMWLDWTWAGGRAGWEREREAGIIEQDDDDGDDAGAQRLKGTRASSRSARRRAVVQV